jgi:hypothetical protein
MVEVTPQQYFSNLGTNRKPKVMPQARVLWDESVGAYRVSTPYSASFVDLLKQLIPIADRVWDPQAKLWTVAERFALPIKNLCEQVWGTPNVQFMDRNAWLAAQAKQAQAYAAYQASQSSSAANAYIPPPPPPRTPVRGEPIDIVMLNFVKLLPYDAAQAAYRKAAVAFHPDHNGGDGSKMSALNATWQRIEAEHFGKGRTS